MIRLHSLLSVSRSGCVILHMACVMAGSDPAFHWDSLRRELRLR